MNPDPKGRKKSRYVREIKLPFPLGEGLRERLGLSAFVYLLTSVRALHCKYGTKATAQTFTGSIAIPQPLNDRI